jgi:hypothetical protein
MSRAVGTDLKGRGLPAPVILNTSDPEAADQIATGKRSQSAKVLADTNQLILQATEDSRYDPPPVDRKVRENYQDYDIRRRTTLPTHMQLLTLSLLLVSAVVVLKY